MWDGGKGRDAAGDLRRRAGEGSGEPSSTLGWKGRRRCVDGGKGRDAGGDASGGVERCAMRMEMREAVGDLGRSI
ncbi:hypothetical protein E2562_019874 [Oryza meyeriana var. granulata]|uniref:DUF834 domain-containing protein n=1 Tax=Oryza meyeriana var. granulata TaxID=110450 RepID=A0A6G1EXG2_9ORYZ|nr:hypothetical protein E2562_019874 [Oryza meyeriana var. granulata]